MTALTNKMRIDALESIIKATTLPQRKADLRALTVDAAWRDMYAAIPKDFRNATKNMPKEWFALQIEVRMHKSINPLTVMEQPLITGGYTYTGIPIEPLTSPVTFSLPSIPANKVPKWAKPLLEMAEKIREDESELRRTTANALAAYTTVEKLVKDFPEFARHVDVPTKAYPVAVNTKKTLDVLSKAGFDTGAKA